MFYLTDENFEKEIQTADRPVLVDFWATWCFPCSILEPILEKISEEFEGEFVLAKVNLDEAPLIAQKYKIERIPAIALFKKGKLVSGFTGLRPEALIKEWLKEALKDN